MRRIDLLAIDKSGELQFGAGTIGQSFVFARDGSASPGRIEVIDRLSGLTRTIRLSASGHARLE